MSSTPILRLIVIAIASSAPIAFAASCEIKDQAQYKEEARDGDLGQRMLTVKYCTYVRLEKIAVDSSRNRQDSATGLEVLGKTSQAEEAKNNARRSDAEADQCYRERTKILIALQSASAPKPVCKR
jgi:hypothetical protein